MGYWGYFVVGRAERPLAELEALSGAGDMTLRQSAPDGWQVWEFPGGDGDVGNMNDLAGQTGAPALFGYVMDSDCVVVEAARPRAGRGRPAWRAPPWPATWAPNGTGSPWRTTSWNPGTPPSAPSPGPPRRDVPRAPPNWRGCCRTTRRGARRGGDRVLAPGPVAENLFFRFLDRLGVVPL